MNAEPVGKNRAENRMKYRKKSAENQAKENR